VCFGDLNDMLPGDEKIGGTPKSYDHLGRDVEVECGLSDLGFIGYPFTWTNGREGTNVEWFVGWLLKPL
jgi:hypothetical protein